MLLCRANVACESAAHQPVQPTLLLGPQGNTVSAMGPYKGLKAVRDCAMLDDAHACHLQTRTRPWTSWRVDQSCTAVAMFHTPRLGP